MPSSVVKSYAEKSGKTVEAVETLWEEIKKYVDKKYPKLAKKRKYMYIVSVLGKKLGIKKTKKVKESTGILKLGQLLVEAQGDSDFQYLTLSSVVTIEAEIYNEDADDADIFVESIIQTGTKYSLKIVESDETPLQGGGIVFSITGTIKNIIDWNKSMNTFEEVEEILQQLGVEEDDMSDVIFTEIKEYFNKSKE